MKLFVHALHLCLVRIWFFTCWRKRLCSINFNKSCGVLIWVKVVPVEVDHKFDCYNPHLYKYSPAMSFSFFVERRCELKANVPVNERAGILSGLLLGGRRSQTVCGKSAIYYTTHVNEYFNDHLLRVFFHQRCFFFIWKKIAKKPFDNHLLCISFRWDGFLYGWRFY